MCPLPSAPDRVAIHPRQGEIPRGPRTGCTGLGAAAIAVALAVAASACTQTHVVLDSRSISTGDGHTCAIKGGALYCWGKNDEGQLGVGVTDRQPHPSPMRVGTEADWRAVATGSASSLALKADGTIWSFGANKYGQLGLGIDDSSQPNPTQIGVRSDWTAIAIRFQHACALARDQSLWCWGWNGEGQLGQEDNDDPNSSTEHPQKVRTPVQVGKDHDFVAVDAGDGHTCAIRTNGTLWCWGRNSDLELGEIMAVVPGHSRKPLQVGLATDWRVVRSGQNSTCGIRGGVAYCWGESVTDDKGVETAIPTITPKTNVQALTPIAGPAVAADLSFNTFGGVVLDVNGGAWLWGRNVEGELGRGDTAPHPDLVFQAKELGWSQVSAGRFTTCGILGDRRMVCTGKNDFGQLGISDETVPSVPTFQDVTFPR